MHKRSLASWLRTLEHQHPIEIDLGTERVAEVWAKMQRLLHGSSDTHVNPDKTLTISVAGTNGKGSCVASMEAMLLAHGYSVGAFTSPHFLAYNERIRIAGQPVCDEVLVDAFEQISLSSGSITLTYFEYGTLAALWIFARAQLDVRLLEVGLGGRLDAVNIVDADVAVVTNIALDHQEWLGDTVEQIAIEKLAIARPQKPLIWGDRDTLEPLQANIIATGARIYEVGRDFYAESTNGQATLFYQSFETPMTLTAIDDGGLLMDNKATAVQALLAAGLRLEHDLCRQALNEVTLTGRYQQLTYRGVRVVLDVAHNPAAAAQLASRLSQSRGRQLAIASVLKDKDWDGIVGALSSAVDRWYIAEINTSDRAADAHELLQVMYNRNSSGCSYESISAAFFAAIADAAEGDNVVVLGSFHTVACVLNIILAGEPVD
jgi:dihydrofolate synthase/folylpolyglutamate synthase